MKLLGKQKKALHNAQDDLIAAIQRGSVQYVRGTFVGEISASISKELKGMGAKWDPKKRGWKIPRGQLSVEVSSTLSIASTRFDETLRRIDAQLQKKLPEEISDLKKIEKAFDKTLWKVDRMVGDSLKGIAVPPRLTKEQAAQISAEYTRDLDRYIKDFTEKEITELRERVQKEAFKGYRYEGLVKQIRRSYGVSQNKAKFLARQETSLLMTKFKQTRYEGAGVEEYIWTTVKGSSKHPVRPMHKALDGKKFRWDSPPVTNPEGGRNNPGQDFNCRCYARPIVRF